MWRKLSIMKELVQEYELSVDMVVVASNHNLAYKMTGVPHKWHDMVQKEAEPVQQACAAFLDKMCPSQKKCTKAVSTQECGAPYIL